MLKLLSNRLQAQDLHMVFGLDFVAQLVTLKVLVKRDCHRHVHEVDVVGEPGKEVWHMLCKADEVTRLDV